MNLEKEDLKILTLGGLVHDIGKIKIDKKILNKPGKLTEKFDDNRNTDLQRSVVYVDKMIVVST